MPPRQMVVSAILRPELSGASQELRHVSTNMPFRVTTSPTFLYVARKRIVAVFAESTALGLAFFACYQYVQMSHINCTLTLMFQTISLPVMHWGPSIIPTSTWDNVLAVFTHPDAHIREYVMFHSVHTLGTSWIFFFIEHIIFFVCDGLLSVGLVTNHIGVKSHGVGNGVKRSKCVRTYAPPHGCARTGVGAPAHTR